MKYSNVICGTFLERPNRFLAKVLIDGSVETVHVKNTGRCKELLIPGAKVYLSVSDNPKRKTVLDLIAVEKKSENGDRLINMDSQAPNEVVAEWILKSDLFSENATLRREISFGSSRFDLAITDGDDHAFIEVKGVTLEKNGVAMFPDAPTERGVKHLRELILAKEKGYRVYVLFVIQMKGVQLFRPNDKTHPEFANALKECRDRGVGVLAYDCNVTADTLAIDAPVFVEYD